MPDVERMAGRIVMLHQGRVLLDRDLDSLREEHCLAMVPRDAGADAELLAGLPGCIGARERSGGVHALFRLTPSGCQQLLEERFGLVDANCTTIATADFFGLNTGDIIRIVFVGNTYFTRKTNWTPIIAILDGIRNPVRQRR